MALSWPGGVVSAGVACGIKRSGAPDLGVLVAPVPVVWAGTFTRNAAAAAPVHWCRERLGAPVRAVVANSGNANACTGRAGRRTVERTAAAAAAALRAVPEEILVASTGPIGFPLDAGLIEAALPGALAAAGPDPGNFARAIMTTDTVPKLASAPAGDARVVGVAKGAAMLAPSMATMLAFLVTDAPADAATLQEALSDAVERTFNRLCIDACESTNDSVVALSTGDGPRCGPAELAAGLRAVCADLARQIARDAEGATRLVRVAVRGARDESHAAALGRAVAASDLVRAALHGADPNWGRVVAALGATDRALDPDRVTVALGDVVVFRAGEPTGDLAAAAARLEGAEVAVVCEVGSGPGEAEVLSADLSEEYVRLNAEGTS